MDEFYLRFALRSQEALEFALDPKNYPLPVWVKKLIYVVAKRSLPVDLTDLASWPLDLKNAFLEGVLVGSVPSLPTTIAEGGNSIPDAALQTAPEELKAVFAKIKHGDLSGILPEMSVSISNNLLNGPILRRKAFSQGVTCGLTLANDAAQMVANNNAETSSYHVLLLLYWPEISKMHSYREAYQALAPFFGGNVNLLGSGEVRFKKIAQRIKLSFPKTQKL